MIKRIDTKSGKIISYVYNLKDEDYKILSERLEIEEDKIKNVIDEEIFTPRISKSDWEIYKLYYPTVKKSTKDKEFTSYEINPIVIFLKEDKIVILDDDYYNDFYQFVEEYTKLRNDVLEENRFFLNMLHKISQSLYKYVRILIGEHDKIETVLREQQSNEKLISLSEVEQGFYVYNIALRNLDYVVENLKEDEQFEQYEEYMTRILQEINFTLDLSSSYCEICKTTRETYSSYIGNNMNITMKLLAAVTILITVPNMIFGFYGMNVKLPFQEAGFFALGTIFVIMMVLMVILWKYLKKKGVTLISLVIIVVVLLVLSSIIIYVNTSGGTLAARVDKQSKTANEQYLVEESKVIISETYGQKKGTTKDEILNLEREKLDNLKKQYEKRGGKAPETLKVNEDGDIEIRKGNVVSFKETTGLTILEAVELTRD